MQGLRPTLPQGPEEGTARLAAVLGACWAAEPGQRPSAAQVADELEALLGQHTQVGAGVCMCALKFFDSGISVRMNPRGRGEELRGALCDINIA